jgi:hypothetical protein
MRRFLRFASVGLVLIGVIAAAVQAAPSTKNYTATVRVTDGSVSGNKFTVTLTNDPRSNQTLGSANFTAPSAFTLAQGSVTTTRSGWTATVVGNDVQFRSTSNALGKGNSVSADVVVTSPSLPTTQCSAAWVVHAKQSNDFSGTGNDFNLLSAGTDLTPLGKLTISDLGTDVTGSGFVPQILTGKDANVVVTATDTCGALDADYTGASLSVTPLVPDRLQGATLTQPTLSGGVGTGSLNPVVVETGDELTVTDSATNTHITSTSNPFDVVETICAVGDTCTWQDKKVNPSILASSTVPTDNHQSLGLGFNDTLSFTCAAVHSPVGNSLLNINPHNYLGNYQITLLYKKSISGSRPANSFVVCLSDTNGQSWSAPLADCGTVPVAPCVISRKRVNGGDLQIILYLSPSDPWGGVG